VRTIVDLAVRGRRIYRVMNAASLLHASRNRVSLWPSHQLARSNFKGTSMDQSSLNGSGCHITIHHPPSTIHPPSIHHPPYPHTHTQQTCVVADHDMMPNRKVFVNTFAWCGKSAELGYSLFPVTAVHACNLESSVSGRRILKTDWMNAGTYSDKPSDDAPNSPLAAGSRAVAQLRTQLTGLLGKVGNSSSKVQYLTVDPQGPAQ
jgi:hypothetical protein